MCGYLSLTLSAPRSSQFSHLGTKNFRRQISAANSRQIGAIVNIAMYGDVKFSKGKHCASLGVHIVVKRCIVTKSAVYGCTMYQRKFSVVWSCV